MEKFCTSCGSLTYPKNKNKGSIGIEAGLLIISFLSALLNIIVGLFLFAGFVIYCIWRLASKHQVCSNCESKDVIPANSPMAQAMVKEIYNKYHQ